MASASSGSARRRRAGRTAWLVVAAVLAVACNGGEEPVVIDWDLSSSHTAGEVDPGEDPASEDYNFEPVASVRLALPGGEVFEAGEGDVHDVTVARAGEVVEEILVDYAPRSAEEAHELAVALAGEWGTPREQLDGWLADARAARDGGDEADAGPVTSAANALNAPGAAFYPAVEIRYSLDPDNPWIVSFGLSWPPEGDAAPSRPS